MKKRDYLSQIWCLIAGVLYCGWSIFMKYAMPEEYDSLPQRFTIGGALILTYILSRHVDWFKKHVETISYVLTFIMAAHYYYLTYMSGMSPIYLIGCYIFAGATGFAIFNFRVAVAYFIFIIGMALVVGNITDLRWQFHSQLIAGLVTIHSLSVGIIRAMISMETELELQRLKSENSARMASLGEMAGGIAHEINNPLAIFQGFLDKMRFLQSKGQLTPEEFDRLTSKMNQIVGRIVQIIAGLRKFSRDDSKTPFVSTDLRIIVDESFALLKEKLKTKGIKFEHVRPKEPIFVDCREVQISQILFNLASNSVDAIQGLEERWIRVQYRISNHKAELLFTDSGHGLPKEIHGRIFDPFFTTKPVGKGTGLGLSISHSLMLEHKGDLELNPNSENTQFILRFKLSESMRKAA